MASCQSWPHASLGLIPVLASCHGAGSWRTRQPQRLQQRLPLNLDACSSASPISLTCAHSGPAASCVMVSVRPPSKGRERERGPREGERAGRGREGRDRDGLGPALVSTRAYACKRCLMVLISIGGVKQRDACGYAYQGSLNPELGRRDRRRTLLAAERAGTTCRAGRAAKECSQDRWMVWRPLGRCR